MCSECSKSYSRQDRLTAHLKSDHGMDKSLHRKRFKCPFCDVMDSFHTFNQLRVHCDKEHEKQLGKINILMTNIINVNINFSVFCVKILYIGIRELKFPSWVEFSSWKEKEEERTHTYYTTEKRYRPAQNNQGTCTQYTVSWNYIL